jgi:hypothetical protein
MVLVADDESGWGFGAAGAGDDGRYPRSAGITVW